MTKEYKRKKKREIRRKLFIHTNGRHFESRREVSAGLWIIG
jgi:hypothetical protein